MKVGTSISNAKLHDVEGQEDWRVQADGSNMLLKTRQSSQNTAGVSQPWMRERPLTYWQSVDHCFGFNTRREAFASSFNRLEFQQQHCNSYIFIPVPGKTRDCFVWCRIMFHSFCQDTINNVKSRLGKSMQIQTVLRAFEARDRNIQESNYDRVNFWSIVNLVVMMMVSAVQVYLVRSLFEDKRKNRT